MTTAKIVVILLALIVFFGLVLMLNRQGKANRRDGIDRDGP